MGDDVIGRCPPCLCAEPGGLLRESRAQALVDEAIEALAPYGADAENLRDAARFVISRDS